MNSNNLHSAKNSDENNIDIYMPQNRINPFYEEETIYKEQRDELINSSLSLRKKKLYKILMSSRTKKFDENSPSQNEVINKIKNNLFSEEKINDIYNKINYEGNKTYLRDKKTIDIIAYYSEKIFTLNKINKIFCNKKIVNLFLNEINIQSNENTIDFDIFNSYLIIYGNFLVYDFEFINQNDIVIFLEILLKMSKVCIYTLEHYEIINNLVWIIYLYIYKEYNIDESEETNIINILEKDEEIILKVIKSIDFILNDKFLKNIFMYNSQIKKETNFKEIINQILLSTISIYNILLYLLKDGKNINKDVKREILEQINFVNLIELLKYSELKNYFDEKVTDIIVLLSEISSEKLKFLININTVNIIENLFSKYSENTYVGNSILKNLLIVLFRLIEFNDEKFYDLLFNTKILPITIQKLLFDGSLINLSLITINLLFKFQENTKKLIIQCINYKLGHEIKKIILSTQNNNRTFVNTLRLIINVFLFLRSNLKDNSKDKINKYFDNFAQIKYKIEQLLLMNDNEKIINLSKIIYKDFINN